MGLFVSKAEKARQLKVKEESAEKEKLEKQFEDKMTVKRASLNMKKFISNLEKKQEMLVNSAKEAKLNGIESQYQLALTGLKMTLGQKKTVQTTLLNLEITTQTNEVMKMSNDFLSSMSVLTNQMNSLATTADFVKLQKDFQSAIMATANQTEKMNQFLETTESMYSEMSSMMGEDNDVLNSEILSLVNGEAAQKVEASQTASEASKLLEDIQRLKELV